MRFRYGTKGIQARRWKQFQAVLMQSPYYRVAASQHKALPDYPKVNKSLFMEHFDQINTRGIQKEAAFKLALEAETSRNFSPMINGVTIGLSSGTSGNRGIFLASEKERAQWVACVLDRVIGISFKKRKVAFFLRANSNLYDSVKSKLLSFTFFDLMDELELQIPVLNALQPTILVAPASVLEILGTFQTAGSLKISPQKIISVAEVLYPETRAQLEKTFNQTIHQVYQCTEGMLAATCEEGTLHFNEDFLFIEKLFVDEDQQRFHPVITDLIRSSQPIVRYELNDLVTEKKSCPCGSKHLAIAQIEGRSDDILYFPNFEGKIKRVFPDFIRRAIILSNGSINDYQAIQSDRQVIQLYVNGDENSFSAAKKAVEAALDQLGITQITIEKLPAKQHSKGEKLRRVRNDYKQTS